MATRKIFVRRFNEWWESVGKQGFEERNPNEGYQSHEDEQEFTHGSTKDNEDLVKE